MFNSLNRTALLAAVLMGPALTALAQEEDGAPHIAVVQDGSAFEIEFEVETGLDESGAVPTLTLDASLFSLGNYQTIPLNDTPSLNDDLGFVSEVEGGPEGGTLDANIVVRRLSASDNFVAFNGVTPIFTAAATDLALGSAFDLHPTWALTNAIDDLTPATASFEIFDVAGGGEVSLGQFDIVLVVPEPASAALLAALAPLALRRRRG